jgi:hypothetical protein
MRARVGVAMETGKQPCEDFDPGSPSGSFLNYHECPGCPGTRRFCANCKSDHHSSGWDTCLAAERAAHAVTRQKLERLQTAARDVLDTYAHITKANQPRWLTGLRAALEATDDAG